MNEVMKTVLSLSLSGSLPVLILLACRPLYRNRLSRRWQYYIWLVAVARLLLPVSPEGSPVGALFQEREPPPVRAEAGAVGEADALIWPEEAPAAEDSPPAAVPESEKAIPASHGYSGAAATEYLWLLWLGPALALLIRKATVYQSFVKYVRAGREEAAGADLLDRLAQLGEEAGVKRPVELYVNHLISSPLLLGLFRPCIVLPAADLPEEDFRYTVLHELTHCRRRDMLYKWLVQLTVCLHWFNPLVWLMEREVRRACELSCDEAVVRRLDARERKAYGDTLLRALEAGGGYQSSPASISLSEGAKLLKERLKAIMDFRKRSPWTAVLSLVMAAALALGATAAGAYTGPAGEKAAPPDVKGDSQAGFRYTQEAYYQVPCFFEIGWNVSGNAGRTYARTTVTLESGRAMTVYYEDACRDQLKDQKVYDALTAVLSRLWKETRDTEFPLTRPLLVGIRETGGREPAALAEQYYEEGHLPSFGAAFALADEEVQRALLEKIYSDDAIAFFALALDQLEADDPLVDRFAEKAYSDGEIAFFSVLAGHMGEKTLESWLARAEKDGRTGFRSMLYGMLDRDEDLEDMKAALEKRQAAEYADYGIVKDGFVYTCRGQRVHIFLDLRADGSFAVLNIDPEGTVDVKITRDAEDRIKSVGSPTEAELEELLDGMDDPEDGGWDEDWDGSGKQPDPDVGGEPEGEAGVKRIPVSFKTIAAGEAVCLGEYTLSAGDRIRYDILAETGDGMQVFFAEDERKDTVYWSVHNLRQQGETLRCTADMTVGPPAEPGTYKLFLKATDGSLGGVTGSVALSLKNDSAPDAQNLSVEDLPAEVGKALENCDARKWYVIRSGDRQYIWYDGFDRSFGYQPVRTAEQGLRVDFVLFHKKEAGTVLLSLPDSEELAITVDGAPVHYTVIEAAQIKS